MPRPMMLGFRYRTVHPCAGVHLRNRRQSFVWSSNKAFTHTQEYSLFRASSEGNRLCCLLKSRIHMVASHLCWGSDLGTYELLSLIVCTHEHLTGFF